MKAKVEPIITVFWLLSLAILGTIYLAWAIYPLENHWLGLADTVYMSDKTLYYNINHLMKYLTLPWMTELRMPDFPSSKDALAHFRDVKHLFHLAQTIFLLGLWPAVHFLRQQWRSRSLWLFKRLWLILIALPLVLGALGYLIGFQAFFTLFHQLLFPGASNWLFNPYTDPVIWVLPEAFFLHAFIIFFVSYEGIMLFLLALSRLSYKCYQKER